LSWRRLLGRKEHLAAGYDTRPIPGDRHQFDPYFVAMCEGCDWVGDFHAVSEDAFEDAYEHTPSVDRVVKRPLG
jgi:hypothetical protein